VSVDQFLNTAELTRQFATILVSVTTIHIAALKSCGASDLKRAARRMGVPVGGKIETAQDFPCSRRLRLAAPRPHPVAWMLARRSLTDRQMLDTAP
jgi:hypothetical protein